MDIKTSKIELAKLVLSINNGEFIQKITDFINKEKDDFWNDLTYDEQQEIKKGIAQLDEGKGIPYDEVVKKIS